MVWCGVLRFSAEMRVPTDACTSKEQFFFKFLCLSQGLSTQTHTYPRIHTFSHTKYRIRNACWIIFRICSFHSLTCISYRLGNCILEKHPQPIFTQVLQVSLKKLVFVRFCRFLFKQNLRNLHLRRFWRFKKNLHRVGFQVLRFLVFFVFEVSRLLGRSVFGFLGCQVFRSLGFQVFRL